MLSLTAKMNNINTGKVQKDLRIKRKKVWYHVDRKPKRLRLIHCCDWSFILEEGGRDDAVFEICSTLTEELEHGGSNSEFLEKGLGLWKVENMMLHSKLFPTLVRGVGSTDVEPNEILKKNKQAQKFGSMKLCPDMPKTIETNKLVKKDPEAEENRSPVKDLIVLFDVNNGNKNHCSDWP